MELNKIAIESLQNVRRRLNKDYFYSYEFYSKIQEELGEWSVAENDAISEHCPELSELAEETSDIILVMLSYAAYEGIDIEQALRIKHEYNLKRND